VVVQKEIVSNQFNQEWKRKTTVVREQSMEGTKLQLRNASEPLSPVA